MDRACTRIRHERDKGVMKYFSHKTKGNRRKERKRKRKRDRQRDRGVLFNDVVNC
jgi:hypothetical protein